MKKGLGMFVYVVYRETYFKDGEPIKRYFGIFPTLMEACALVDSLPSRSGVVVEEVRKKGDFLQKRVILKL